jgi:excinuclease ABC subunit C
MLSQNTSKKQYITHILQNIPHKPGVYKMKDEKGGIIYIGKAIDLKNRVSSYFNNQPKDPKTEKMVEQIRDIDYTIVGTGLEAIILESNLIKELRPKYNILMKDDKNYVYLKITVNEPYPRIYLVRKVAKDKAKYYGPKTAAYKLINTLKLLQRVFPFKNCQLAMDYNIHAENKYKHITEAQIEYHRRHCIGPCITSVSPEEYGKTIDQVIAFFEGKHEEIIKQIKADMLKAANEKKFEVAAGIRDKLKAIEEMTEKQRISDPTLNDMDIINYFPQDNKIYFNLFQIRDGKLIGQENFVFTHEAQRSVPPENSDTLTAFLEQYYEKATDIPKEILIPHQIDEPQTMENWLCEIKGQKVTITVPERGKKNHLLDLSLDNAKSFASQSVIKWQGTAKETREQALSDLQNILKLETAPTRIECYDVSHHGGVETVGSMVVFEKGFPKKEDYRHFKLHQETAGAPDDYASMREIMTRRLKYLKPAISEKETKIRKPTKKEIPIIAKTLKVKKLPDKTFFVIEKLGIYSGFIQISIQPDKKILIEKIQNDSSAQNTNMCAIIKKIPEKFKTERVYILIDTKDLERFEDAGCQQINRVPESIAESAKMKKDQSILVYDKTKHSEDKSFKKTPDIIIIDGGKGQLSSALEILKQYDLKLVLISIAKKEEEIFTPNSSQPINLAKNDPVLHLIEHLRDESHRFAVTYHQKIHLKNTTTSILDTIPGIGYELKMRLLKHFGSPESIKNAPLSEVEKIVGAKAAKKLKESI